jgi:Tfp pilus assembly pilus retraction ATPase PilT
MDQCLQMLVEKRIITAEEAREKARQPDSITA